ncbi:hypothetical protein C0993_006281 [Termitomyces sp. T159_Od127]|nr:hypothetical protein C0993_006281 [Termitomyces sp. T159_Od127]
MPQPAHAPLPSSRFHKKWPLQTQRLKITVSLFRQSRIETKGEKSFSNRLNGEGKIRELPLGIQESSNMIHLDWEGEVKSKQDVTVGGFTAGNVCVKDFVVLLLEPPLVDNEPSPFLPLQITVPIRLVTDSFMEITDYEPPPV